jgi:hypothetical protein
MISKLMKFLGIRPKAEWWEEDFILGNPFSESDIERLRAGVGEPISTFCDWNPKEVAKRKEELRPRRETTPVTLPSIPIEKLSGDNLKPVDFHETFNKLGLL